jgi:polar amino acid transport system substrate-binding protein
VKRISGLVLVALLWAAGAGAADHEGLAAVQERGYVKVCADPSNLPYSSKDPSTPGFEVELARLIAGDLQVAAQFFWQATYQRALKPLREGSCELFMGLPTDQRFKEGNPWIAVSRPYYEMVHGLVTRAGSPDVTLKALTRKRVAVEMASIAEFHIGYMDIERGLYRTQAQAFAAAADGSASAALLWYPVAAWLARGHPGLQVVPIREDILAFSIGAGVRRRDAGLAPAVDAAVGRLLDSGRAQAVLARYGAVPPARSLGDRTALAQARNLVEAGRGLFSTTCSHCHGAQGAGGGAGGNLPVLRGYDGGQERFVRIVMNGRKNTAMGGFKGILSEQEVLSIYQYLVSLKKS